MWKKAGRKLFALANLSNCMSFEKRRAIINLYLVILPPLLPPPSWFSLNNSKTVNAIILAFCSIQ